MKSVNTVTKKKEQTKKQKGDLGEQFVSGILNQIGYITEIHPRTYRSVHLKGGKRILVSLDNDYHNSFDVKGEREDGMIYAQVKWFKSGTVDSGHISAARRKINKNYPYFFKYQRLQVWMVWKEWASTPGKPRHKEWNFRVWQRFGLIESRTKGIHTFAWDWKEVTNDMKKEWESYQDHIKLKSEESFECNSTMPEEDKT
ncbi:hypothetical protein [Caldiplasma sukawensis]